MPKIKIIAPGAAGDRHVVSAHGTKIFVDDKELQDVGDIEMKFPVDGAIECHVGMFATEGFELETGADVHIHVHIPENHGLVDVTNQDHEGRHYRILRVKR